jgi:16S rRNA (adenine1518-N6/adenine1519-N6)-dimethyltransferase
MRKYGQHFLISQKVIEGIVAAVPASAKSVVEIGPGKGALTEHLIQKNGSNFTAVEIDPEMQNYLQEHFPALQGRVILQNFLKFDLNLLPQEPTFFVSNLPYIDAADILDKVLNWPLFDGAVFMFQKEQAQRILAKVGAEGYGPLSLLSQVRSEVKQYLKVGKACFNPPPKVESMVLTFQKKQWPLKRGAEYARFARLVKAAFLHRRKTLFNSLSLCGYEKDKVEKALHALDLKPTVRAEEVSLEQFLQLSKVL